MPTADSPVLTLSQAKKIRCVQHLVARQIGYISLNLSSLNILCYTIYGLRLEERTLYVCEVIYNKRKVLF